VRDARITLIYEGTNGIQALDLVGRKLAMNGMRPINSFFGELDALAAAGGSDATQPFLDALAATKAQLKEATDWLVENGPEGLQQCQCRFQPRLSAPVWPDLPHLHVGIAWPRCRRRPSPPVR
jgi:hypothetical protein